MEKDLKKEFETIREKIGIVAPSLADYSHISLTEDELNAAILRAKMDKDMHLNAIAKRQRKQEKIEELMKPMGYDDLKRLVLDKAERLPFRFKLDKFNERTFYLLCLYFSRSPEFEKHGLQVDDQLVQKYSHHKGILLYSKERGPGKTTFMSLFSQNSKNCYAVISSKKISSFYQVDGARIIERYSKPWLCEKAPMYLYQSPIGICFDDLGDEEVKNHFGNKENVMQRIMQAVYDDGRKEDFQMFHATTNYTPDEIEEIYGNRVRSRMREMFNLIELPGPDRRD